MAALFLMATACSSSHAQNPDDPPEAIRLLFVGDAMLGRGIAPIVEGDPEGLLRDIRRVVRSADIAAVNVESPLTERPHSSANPYELEADPQAANLLAEAGFDVAGVANNHAGDAGAGSIVDSLDAIRASGMSSVGGGRDRGSAWSPLVVEVDGIRVAYLAIDASGQGLAATDDSAGVASWHEGRARAAVSEAMELADIVAVGLHGGVAYLVAPDPLLSPIAEELASWGVDIVWGHGPHVGQPITVVDRGDRRSVVATSLGNFIFDQQTEETSNGLILEVLVDRDGVIAHRIGGKHHDDLRVHFAGWEVPDVDAAAMDGSWWSIDRRIDTVDTSIHDFTFAEGDVTSAGSSDLDGDGVAEILVSYRHALTDKPEDPLPPPNTDLAGRSAHIGVVTSDGSPVWLSRRPPHAVQSVASCDGSAAFAYSTLDSDAVIATGAGTWAGFGFTMNPALPGAGNVACADIDGDGYLEPVVTSRSGAAIDR